jgi:hypothetical protein
MITESKSIRNAKTLGWMLMLLKTPWAILIFSALLRLTNNYMTKDTKKQKIGYIDRKEIIKILRRFKDESDTIGLVAYKVKLI